MRRPVWGSVAWLLVATGLVARADGPESPGLVGALTGEAEAPPAPGPAAGSTTLVGQDGDAAPVDSAGAAAARLAAVRDWAYQLQELDPAQVAGSKFDLLVTDPSRDGTDGDWWPPATVARLRSGGRLAIAYVSIGEAESYRGYWRPEWKQHPPAWLGPENPDWKGNYAVRFWDPGWRAILFADQGPLARVVAAGWDGVYLDLVDVYERWAELGELKESEGQARMAAFVRDVAAFCRARKPGFLVIPQNGSAVAARDDVLPHIDGLGLEDTFFDDELPQSAAHTKEVLAHAERLRAAGKKVLAVDYCRAASRVARFYARARQAGLVPYATVRELNRLTVDPGFEPQ